MLLRAAFADFLLNVAEGGRYHIQAARIGAYTLQQAADLFLGPQAGIGRAGKMNGRELHPALSHHPGRHRAVDAAADEHSRASAGTHRDAARTGQGIAVDVSGNLAHLHAHRHIRLADIHRQVRVLVQNSLAHLRGNLRRSLGKALVGALRFHLKRPGAPQCAAQVSAGLAEDALHRLFGNARPGIGDDAEDARHLIHCRLKIGRSVQRLNINRGLRRSDAEIPQRLQPAADIFH